MAQSISYYDDDWDDFTDGDFEYDRVVYEDSSSPEPESEEDIKPITFSADSINPQLSSSFFSLPAEIRGLIYGFALRDYGDKASAEDDASWYKGPGYLAPSRIDTQILRTCKKVYIEAWSIPWANAVHRFVLAQIRWFPPATTVGKMRKALRILHASHAKVAMGHVRVFAELCELESGENLTEILDVPHFCPKVITITIRHTDWWGWESDRPLHMGERWVNICKFPESVKQLKIEFESLKRKKTSVDQVAEQAIKKWEFERKDGVIMSAEGCIPTIARWTGASTWEGVRWLRDETRPNQVDYYVATVTWRPAMEPPPSVLPEGVDTETHEPQKRKVAEPLDAEVEDTLSTDLDSIRTTNMVTAKIPLNAPADEVRRLFHEYYSPNNQYQGQRQPYDDDDYDDDDDDYDDDDDEDDDYDYDYNDDDDYSYGYDDDIYLCRRA